MDDSSPEAAADSIADAAAELLEAAAALDAPAPSVPGEPLVPPVAAAVSSEQACIPKHARGLLHLRLPVTVTLASQRKSIQEIVELGPGAIVKFEKTCDEPLELNVGNRLVATGEVVKVGDKFGLRIGQLITTSQAS